MDISELYEKVHKTVTNELQPLLREQDALERATEGEVPFDARYNAVSWAFDCLALACEIAYSYHWMEAHAATDDVKRKRILFYLRYFADNCITRIDSFRDKAALLVWAYHCPFNPERRPEVLEFEGVLERLRCPTRFGLRIVNQGRFLNELEKLDAPCFKRAATYRHLKIHRLEPKILMWRPTESDGPSYMFPLFKTKEIEDWQRRLKKQYPDDHLRHAVEENCYIDGTLFDRRQAKGEHWHYKEVEKFTHNCVDTCIDVAMGLSAILRRRAPLRNKK